MKFTLSWLKEHLDTTAILDQITEALTDLGLEVEEVRDPARTIPRAIVGALAIAVAVYAVVAVSVLVALGPARLAGSAAPLADAVRAGSWSPAVPVVVVGGAAAALGALLALIAGIGRTALAMAREGDLPPVLAAVHPRHQIPHRAEITLAVAVCVLVSLVDLRAAIGFSSFGVLLYYFVANVSAFTQPAQHRRFPRWLQVLGASGCLLLVATLPWQAVVAGVGMFVVGAGYRAVHLTVRRRSSPNRGDVSTPREEPE